MSEGQLRDGGAYVGRPSVCRNCGALVGAGEAACSVCGAPVSQQLNAQAGAPPVVHDREAMRFIRAIVSRPATFTIIFIVANIFLYTLVMLSGGADNPGILIAYGAKLNSLIDVGEWWRFVTPVFLHGGPSIGIFHLLVNMYGLFMLGPYVEKLYGSARFVVFWVLTGVGGVAASYYAVRPGMEATLLGRFLFKASDVPSVGASGALFGLVGVLFVFGIKFRHELPEDFKRAFGTGMLPIILINLFIGFMFPFIDNAAHLGGLFSGMALALFVGYKRPGARGPVDYVWHILQALALLLVVTSFVMVGLHFNGPAPSLRNVREAFNPNRPSGVQRYVDAMNAGQRAFFDAMRGNTETAATALQQLSQVPPLGERPDKMREELQYLITRAVDFSTTAATSPPPQQTRAARIEREQRAEQLRNDYTDWENRFNEWVKTEGGQVGIEIVEPAEGDAPQEQKPQEQK